MRTKVIVSKEYTAEKIYGIEDDILDGLSNCSFAVTDRCDLLLGKLVVEVKYVLEDGIKGEIFTMEDYEKFKND